MTRDEAIDIINGEVGTMSERENEALDMAIEALEKYEEAYEHGWTDAECKYRVRDRGEWIIHKHAEIIEGRLITNYECSNCHTWSRYYSNYCPDCGLDMRERRENEHTD